MGFLKKIFGSHSDHELKRLYPLADKIDALSDEYAALTDELGQVAGIQIIDARDILLL